VRWWILALLAAACGNPASELRAARDAARMVLSEHCGSCHTNRLPTALPAALAVYDLDEPGWAVRMSAAQLDSASWRLKEPLAPGGTPNDVSAAEGERFARYVALEKAARATAPACPSDEVLEAVHAAAYRLEHDGPSASVVAGACARVLAPLDETTRSLLADLARAALDPDPRPATEQIRARLAAWPCLTEAKHGRFHEQL
jgi:mono/diheme cytochrome c family protein